MRKWGLLAALLLALPGRTPPATAQDKPAPQPSQEITPEAERAIARGLARLAQLQSPRGSFEGGAAGGGAPVATSALAGLAFLAGGHLPGRTKYGENVRRTLKCFMDRWSDKRGYLNEGANASRGMGGSGMHGHGYALLFLSQIYGMNVVDLDDSEKLKEILTRAVRVSEQAQADSGGWTYEPTKGGDEGSVTITQVQALRAVHNAGIRVNMRTIEKAVEYINKTTNDAGQTAYSLSAGGGGGTPSLTAAGMCVLTYLGQYNNPKVTKGLNWLMKVFKPGTGQNAQRGGFYFYPNYYAAVAMYQAGGNYWAEWWPAIRQDLIKSQSGDGGWKTGESGQYGEAFGTALALLILQVPYRYLPIFQRASD